jgi:hypothetical protein
MLAQLDQQATLFDDTRLPLLQPCKTAERVVSEFTRFNTIDDAQADLARLLSSLTIFLVSNAQYKRTPVQELPVV